MSEPELSIVLPVYNQADHIGGVVDSYMAALNDYKRAYEIVLVVNAAGDRSLEVAEDLARRYDAVRVVHTPEAGWGRAVRLGLAASRGRVVGYTNSARTSPHLLVMMLSYAFANPGTIVKANRRLRHPIVRRIGSVLYNVECRILFSLAVWDVNGTPKIFDRGVAEAFELQENGDLIDLEFVVKARVHDRPILEVPVVSAYRHGGRSTTNFGSAFTMYRGALRLWREYRRMLPSADRIARS